MVADMKLSLVTTLYKSAEFVEEFYQRASRAAQLQTNDYELIFVDDGSPDDSAAIVRKLMQQDARVVLVELSRNFGHHYAQLAGIRTALGDLVFYLDVDLENPPEWLDLFMQEQAAHACDVVYAKQAERSGSWFRRFSGEAFYWLFNRLAGVRVVANICPIVLLTRTFVDALGSLRENNLFLPANVAWLGFRTRVLTVQRQQRRSPSSYTLRRKLGLFVNALTSFSAYPLQIIFMVGLLLFLCFGGMGAYMLVKKLLFPERVFFGYASIIVSIWFLSGLLILFIGVIGIYLAQIFTEVKERPQYIIRRIYRNPAAELKEGQVAP